MDHALLLKAVQAAKKNQSYAFATVVESTAKGTPQKAGAKMIVLEDGSLFGTIGGGRNEKAAREECLKAMTSSKSGIVTYNYFGGEGQSVCGGQIKVFIEPFINKKKLIICGAGHIALPLSALGKILNFNVTIIDNRVEFANKKRFPHVDKIVLGEHGKELAKILTNEDSYIMVVTQGNEFDFECLREALKKDFGYLGVISSKAKRIKFFKRLQEAGIKDDVLKKVQIPAGVDIGALTPEEIATSIMAEMIAWKNKTLIGTDKFKEKVKSKARS
jgi:xanthine dehydrogenase accessory factor